VAEPGLSASFAPNKPEKVASRFRRDIVIIQFPAGSVSARHGNDAESARRPDAPAE
jgi:hypothetical protein